MGRAAVGAITVRIGSGGKPKPKPPPKLSEAQTWAAIADCDDLLEDALIYFGRVSAPDPGQHPRSGSKAEVSGAFTSKGLDGSLLRKAFETAGTL